MSVTSLLGVARLERYLENSKYTTLLFFTVPALIVPGFSVASTPEAWGAFRKDVAEKCLSLAAASYGGTHEVIVDKYGTEGYGVAIIQSKDTSGYHSRECIYDKRTKKAKISGESTIEAIERKRKNLPTDPDYLFDTSTISSAISTVWMKLTSSARSAGDIQARYDETYLAAVEYLTLAELELVYAERLLKLGDTEAAQRHIINHDHLIKMHHLSNEVAIKLYQGDVESAAMLAQGFYEGSKEAISYGVCFAGLGPVGRLAVDAVLLSSDFAVDFSEVGMDEATKNLVKAVIVKAVISDLGIVEDTKQYIGKSGLYAELSRVSESPEVRQQLMSFVSVSTAHGVKKLSKESVYKISGKLSDYYGLSDTNETQSSNENRICRNTVALQEMLADEGGCPHEGCRYGDWVATEEIALFEGKSSSTRKLKIVESGEKVTAVTGVVYTSPMKFAVLAPRNSVAYSLENPQRRIKLSYRSGDVLDVYAYQGEGMYKVSFNGEMYSEVLGDEPGSANCKSNSNHCWGTLDGEYCHV